MKVIYSYNKLGLEARYWEREIRAASTNGIEYIPFNHGSYLDPYCYIRAQLLDNLYYERHPALASLYADVKTLISNTGARVLLVDNCPPYHPEFLSTLDVYRVLRTSDGPLSAYDRDFAYVHAYDHVLFHSPAYSRDLCMRDKLAYCGARRSTFWPLALFDACMDPALTEEAILSGKRRFDIVYVGALHPGKMPVLARLKRHFGRRLLLRGLAGWKKNAYFNAKYGFPGWVRELPANDYVPLYQQSRIGINLHNRGKYTVGNFRLFELPGNGVMQISDGGEFLAPFLEPGREVIPAETADELIVAVEHFLVSESDRRELAIAGFRAVMERHRIAKRMLELSDILRDGVGAR